MPLADRGKDLLAHRLNGTATAIAINAELISVKAPGGQLLRHMNGSEAIGCANQPLEVGNRSYVSAKWTDLSGGLDSNQKLSERAIDAATREMNQGIMRYGPVINLSLFFAKKCCSDSSEFEQLSDCARRQPSPQLRI